MNFNDKTFELHSAGRAFGITLVTKPVDLDLYRKFLPKSLDMPETPLVGLFNFEFPIKDLHKFIPDGQMEESGILLYCEKDGVKGWAEVAIFISWMGYIIGSLSGSRKVKAKIKFIPDDESLLTQSIKNGKSLMDLCFKHHTFDSLAKDIDLSTWQQAMLNSESFLPQITEPRFIISKLFKQVNSMSLGPIIQDLKTTTGLVDFKVEQGHPWSGLVSSQNSVPGVFLDFTTDWSKADIDIKIRL